MKKQPPLPMELDQDDDALWLLDAPTGALPPPPVATREQRLPFDLLTWQDFERLSMRVARLNGEAEHWQVYGTSGQRQGGIDVYVRMAGSSKYAVWQCKRHQTFSATDIRSAVQTFLAGSWVIRTSEFVLCTSASLAGTTQAEEIERQARVLAEHGIIFTVLDDARLSYELKNQSAIVDDFFDRPWVERFCGRDAASALGNRLGRTRLKDLRAGLANLYENLFASIDPGLLRASSGLMTPPKALPLARRFVAPDLTETEPLAPDDLSRVDAVDSHEGDDDGSRLARSRRSVPRASVRASSRRTGLDSWSRTATRAVVLGEPGAGKSTLLRYMALDLLSASPTMTEYRRRWPTYLPVLLPFAFWTRQIARLPAGPSTSVPGAVAAWLEQLGAFDLARHIGAAFADGRVILLVDGVDEWVDETAAETALSILHAYVATSGIPAVVTSRPHGTRVLGALDASWSRHSLAPLDDPQKRRFVRAWFEWLDEVEGRADSHERISARTDALLSAIGRMPHARALSATPLLLSGLIAIAREGGTLPSSRREAYAELANRMLETHPRLRSRAALVPGSLPEMDQATRRRALAALAYRMQVGGTSGMGIDGATTAEATRFLKGFLVDDLDLAPDRARERAAELLKVGSEALGMLVERAPGELGFVHRAFQELLAAEHLASLDLADQAEIVRQRGDDAQWRDVLLFSIEMASRPSDVAALVEALETESGKIARSRNRDLLLAEIAFGAVRRSPALTRRLASRYLDEVETGRGTAPRADVMRLAVSGLLSEQTSGHVSARIRSWFPRAQPYQYADALAQITSWPEEEVDRLILRSFEADERKTRMQAAVSMAERRGGQADWARTLIGIARRPTSAEAAATAVRCLSLGWSDAAGVADLIEAAAASAEIQLFQTGVEAQICKGRHTEAERDRLLDSFEDSTWEHSGAAALLVAKGWPNDPVVRVFVLERLGRFGLGHTEVRMLAAAAFPGDEDMAMRMAYEMRGPGSAAGFHEIWPLLAKSFAGNAGFADAVRGDAERHDAGYRLAHAARIARTPSIRSELLAVLSKPDRQEFWAVEALSDHWPDDPEVRRALTVVRGWPAARLARVAERIPSIFGDAAAAKGRLRELALRGIAEAGEGLNGSINALVAMHAVDDDLRDRIIDAAETVDPKMAEAANVVIAAAQVAPADPRVRRLAVEWSRKADGPVGVFAFLLRDHEDVRAAVLEAVAPLPLQLRVELVDALSEVAGQSEDALRVLREGMTDGDRAISADATVLHAMSAHVRGDPDDGLSDELVSQLQTNGMFFESIRVAAFAALLAMGRGDLAKVGSRKRDELTVGLSIWQVETDGPVLNALASEWDLVERIIESGDSWLKLEDADLVERLGRYAGAGGSLTSAVDAAAARLAKSDARSVGALRNRLRFPGTRASAADALIDLLDDPRTWADTEVTLAAAAVLAREFGSRQDLVPAIEARLNKGITNGPVAALCDGWPDSVVLRRWFERVRLDPEAGGQVVLPVRMKVLAVMSSARTLIEQLEWLPDRLNGMDWEGPRYWTGNVTRRLASDDEAFDLAVQTMMRTTSPGCKASLASLLVQARGMDAWFREWIGTELGREPDRGLGAVGFDVVAGTQVVVLRRLEDLLESGGF